MSGYCNISLPTKFFDENLRIHVFRKVQNNPFLRVFCGRERVCLQGSGYSGYGGKEREKRAASSERNTSLRGKAEQKYPLAEDLGKHTYKK